MRGHAIGRDYAGARASTLQAGLSFLVEPVSLRLARSSFTVAPCGRFTVSEYQCSGPDAKTVLRAVCRLTAAGKANLPQWPLRRSASVLQLGAASDSISGYPWRDRQTCFLEVHPWRQGGYLGRSVTTRPPDRNTCAGPSSVVPVSSQAAVRVLVAVVLHARGELSRRS